MNQIDASAFYDLMRLVVNRNDDKVRHLADQLFEIYGDNVSNMDQTNIKYSELYIAVIKEVIMSKLNRDNNKIDIRNIIQRYTNNQIFRKDKFILDAFKDILETETPPTRLSDITKRLNNLVAWHISKQYITKLYGHLKESSISYTLEGQTDALDKVKSMLADFKDSLSTVESVSGSSGPVEVIDFNDKESIRNAFNMFKERRVAGSLKSGLQGLNHIFGKDGIALGESVLFAARSHNFKTGMLMRFPSWISKYSIPPVIPGKMPLILILTLENEAYMSMLQMFRQMYADCNGVYPPINMSDDEMIESIYDYYNRHGFALIINRFLPTNFGYDELVKVMEDYENAGYKIVASIVDYVGLMKTSNGVNSRSGDHQLLQDLYCKLVNYHKAVGTTLFTAHQLNRGASDIVASGVPHPVKKFSERHFAGSTGIFREVDKVIYLELEADEEQNRWLTMAFGKARYQEVPERHKFCAYQFTDIGIIDDLKTEFKGVRNIYKKTNNVSQQDIESILGIAPTVVS